MSQKLKTQLWVVPDLVLFFKNPFNSKQPPAEPGSGSGSHLHFHIILRQIKQIEDLELIPSVDL